MQKEKLKRHFLKKQRDNPTKAKAIKSVSSNQKKKWDKDKIVYKQVWDSHPSHRCEECGKFLGRMNLKMKMEEVLHPEYFSHIISKGSNPTTLRWEPLNFNLLCLTCHSRYEFSSSENRKKMKIYDEDKLKKLLELNKQLENDK